MRLHSEDTKAYIQALATSVGKDPASLENWRCVHIEHLEDMPFELYEAMLASLKESHKDLDCDAFHCADNDVFIIGRNINDSQLKALANELVNVTSLHEERDVKTTMFDLFRDWSDIRKLLLSKTGAQQPPSPKESDFNFGELESLKEVFNEAKNFRKARLPLHVMIVEDDPLTRRIVSNSFKDEYALISASDAREAIANYLMHAPDIVFLDIGLPDTSGFSVLFQIMQSDPDAYVVMFSSNSYLDNITRALSNGASGFIAKPFKKEKLTHYIQDSALHHHKYA